MDPQPPDLEALAGRNFGLEVAAQGGPMVACDLRPRQHESSSGVRGVGLLTDGVNYWLWIGSAGASETPFSTLGSDR